MRFFVEIGTVVQLRAPKDPSWSDHHKATQRPSVHVWLDLNFGEMRILIWLSLLLTNSSNPFSTTSSSATRLVTIFSYPWNWPVFEKPGVSTKWNGRAQAQAQAQVEKEGRDFFGLPLPINSTTSLKSAML
jgi:hypothetical protein